MDDRRTPALFGLIGGLVATLIVAVVSTLLAAHADRAESLLQERRSAYADVIGSAQNCESSLRLLDLEVTAKTFGEGESNLQLARRLFSDINDCTLPLQSSAAKVTLLTDDEEVRAASNQLVAAVLRLARLGQSIAVRAQYEERYIDALSRFQVVANDSATAPVVSPVLIQTGGLFLIAAIVGVYVWKPWKDSS